MAVATIPKSEIRNSHSIHVGYATVPGTFDKRGNKAWGLPGGAITRNKRYAEKFAIKLDREIRSQLKNPQQLLTAA